MAIRSQPVNAVRPSAFRQPGEMRRREEHRAEPLAGPIGEVLVTFVRLGEMWTFPAGLCEAEDWGVVGVFQVAPGWSNANLPVAIEGIVALVGDKRKPPSSHEVRWVASARVVSIATAHLVGAKAYPPGATAVPEGGRPVLLS